MPATTFPDYAKELTSQINNLVFTGQARLINLHIDQRSSLLGLISGILAFEDNSELHFREYVDLSQSQPRVMYAYHYQDGNQELIFRYDNATHRPQLDQPDHKHIPNKVSPASAPSFSEVLDEITKGD